MRKFRNKFTWVTRDLRIAIEPEWTASDRDVAAKQIWMSDMQAKGAKRFHSKKEALRFIDLTMLLLAGDIKNLSLQPKFELTGANGGFICEYVSDFRYDRGEDDIVEDAKGVRTPAYKLKKALFIDQFPELTFLES